MDISEVKRNMNKIVNHNGNDYFLHGCILRKNENEFYYEAELKDIKANSVIRCRLEDIDIEQTRTV